MTERCSGLLRRLSEGALATPEEVREAARMPLDELLALAAETTRLRATRAFNFCAIVNARSGRCGENCRWCAQSRHWPTGCVEHPLLGRDRILEAAHRTEAAGIGRLSIVTSGRKLGARELRETVELVRAIREETSLEVCASLGLVTASEARMLRDAGLVRLHCNLEASRGFFPKVCTTHTTEDKIRTLKAAREAGLELCSGGIIGMGETEEDRISLAFELRDLGIRSIPINVLVPIPGTPLADQPRLTDEEILRTIALFRIVNPEAQLRFAGGRPGMSDELVERCLATGINSSIVGDLLTTTGVPVERERERVLRAGYTLEDDAVFDRSHLWHPYDGTVNPEPRLHVKKASGVRLTLADGRELIDGTSAWWCAAHGYGRPEITRAVARQAGEFAHVMFGGLTHDPAIGLGRRLLALLPEQLQKLFFVDSGSVAVEAAAKMAIQYQAAKGRSERTNLAVLERGYHGDTWNAMSMCDPEAGMHGLFGPTLPRRHFVPAPASTVDGTWDPADLEPLQALLNARNDIAALFLEPIFQGASGMRFYHPEYLAGAARLCAEHDVLLVADEIATGFWRTGTRFACDRAGVVPDIMTLGKALSGGVVSMAVVAASNRVADAISLAAPGAFMHGPTYMANPIACAAACASLDLFQTYDAGAEALRIERALKAGLEPLQGRAGVRDVRALGAIGVVELERPADRRILTNAFADAGVWARPFGRFAYLMPPFVITDEELERLLQGFRRGLEAVLPKVAA